MTVLVEPSRDRVQKELIMHLNPKARVIVRPGAMPRTVSEEIRNHFYTQANPICGLRKVIFPRKAYEREFRRLFGEAGFDYIIDYEGFSSFFATICLMQKNAKTCIWMHSDMCSEYRTRFHWLERIFALYPQFDHLVSSSRQLMEVNRDNFSKYVPPEKFKHAKNCVDFASVHTGSREGKIIRRQDEYYYTLLSESDFLTNMKLIPLQPGRFDLSEDKNMELCGCIEAVKNGVIRFVTVGRLSNPFGLMRQCDCFVRPSLYEGQPLVVFEARALHMPIILSDYATIEGSVVTKGQYIVHKEADSIYEGLRAYLLGKVPDDYVFMDEEYNREAYAEFEQAVFGESRMLSHIGE